MMAEALPAEGASLFERWAGRLAELSGLRRLAVAFASGLLASLALPPLHLVFLLVPAFTALVWLVAGATSPRKAAWIGWGFGFGYFAAGLYWVGIAFLVDADRFALIMPVAVAGLAAGMALFPALALYIVVRSGFDGAARIIFLAAAWVFTEWLRSWVLTGFPWNLIGTVWSFSPGMLQLAAFGGVWALSAMTVLVAASPALLGASAKPGARGGRNLFVAVMLLLPLSVWLLGELRLAAAPEQGTADQVSLRIVQPAIEQKLKWERSLKLQHVLRQIEMSRAGPGGPPDVVVWAETAVPYLLEQDTALQSLLATALAEGAVLVTGAPRAGQSLGSPGLRNSLHALDHTGSITATYDKGHLVPFGEYTPLKGWLGLDKLAVGAGDFVPGIGPVTIDLEGLPPFSPLICYEVIFPGQVVAATAAGKRRPEWLLNVTNDGWFGQSSGPYQHFANARLRAVEEGLPLVRAANSGISGVIDGYGRIVARLGLGEAGVLDAKLPRPVEGITLYAIIGNWVLVIELLFLSTAAFIIARRGR